jgi:protein TonB
MVESVEYVRAAPPVSQGIATPPRHGFVILRVLVDALGRPAQIQVELSSGFERLDSAARGPSRSPVPPVRSEWRGAAAQVLIPIGFDRRAS